MLPVQVADELGMAHEVRDVLAQVAFRIDAEVHLGDRVAPFDLVVIVEHRDAIRRRLDRLDEARMLLLDLAHLRMPLLRELVQPVIDFAPDARRARHLAIDGGIEQTPQALRVERTEEALRNQHHDREREARNRAGEHADQYADQHEQHERHEKARPDDVHVSAPE